MNEVDLVTALPGRVRLRVRGLYGAFERAQSIEEAVAARRGVRRVRANPGSGRVLVEFDPQTIALEAIVHAVTAAPLTTRQPVRSPERGEPGFAGEILRLALSGLVLGGLVIGRLVVGAPLLAAAPLLGIGSITTLVTGYPIFRSGLQTLIRERRTDMDLLISSATFASLLLRESLTGLSVVWLINLGDLLQALTLRRSRRAIRDLLSVGDTWAWIVIADQEMRVPLDAVQVGDLVIAHEGSKIAVDGIVVNGEAAVNQATITGESLPVLRRVDDAVSAGTLVEAGHLVVRATAVGDTTTVGRIIRRIEEARDHRAPIQRTTDHVADHFAPFSFALAALVFVLTRDVRRSLSMLVIACPCAAGLSTPTAVGAAIGSAAGRGILIKGGLYLEAVGNLDAVVFDKTGTLTTGVPRITRLDTLSPEYSTEDVLALAAAAERHARHPFAAAVCRRAEEAGLAIPAATEYETLVGLGVRARVAGVRVAVGSRRLFTHLGLAVPDVDGVDLTPEGVLWVAVGDRVVGVLGIDESIRPEARLALDELAIEGVRRLVLATGDRLAAADRVARHLGLPEYRAEVLPEEKLDLIRELQTTGYRVGMVGDGINDAPALVTADVGLALGTAGSDVAIEAADIALASDDLRQVPAVMRLSHRTLGVIRWNYTTAIGVNAIGVALSALGVMSPLVGSIVHNVTTVAVVLNSARLIGYRDSRQHLPMPEDHQPGV